MKLGPATRFDKRNTTMSKKFDDTSSSEIRKVEIPPSEFWTISGDWGKLGIPNFAWMSLMKSYLMLQNARFAAFTVSKLLKENQQGRGKNTPT